MFIELPPFMFPVLVEVVHLLTQAPTVFARSVHFRIDDNSGHFLSHALAHDSDFIVVQPQSGLSEFLSADLNQPGDFPVVRIAGKGEVIRISCKFEIVVQRIELEGEIKIMQQEIGDVRTGHRTLRKMPVQRAEFRKHDRGIFRFRISSEKSKNTTVFQRRKEILDVECNDDRSAAMFFRIVLYGSPRFKCGCRRH